MANCAIVGINWGDEGKGRMVDYLTEQYDVVVRYQPFSTSHYRALRPYSSCVPYPITFGAKNQWNP